MIEKKLSLVFRILAFHRPTCSHLLDDGVLLVDLGGISACFSEREGTAIEQVVGCKL